MVHKPEPEVGNQAAGRIVGSPAQIGRGSEAALLAGRLTRGRRPKERARGVGVVFVEPCH